MRAQTARLASAVILSTVVAGSARAQQTPQVTAADYARAERFLRDNVTPLVSGNVAPPSWLGGERFWYRRGGIGGDLIVVDPTRALRSVCTPDTGRCGAAIDAREAARARAEFAARAGATTPEVVSPDGKRAVFIRDYNLWVRDVPTGHETQLTSDGIKDFGYATDNAGWVRSDSPILLWSPDSRKIATFQQDERGVGKMYLVNTKVGHPDLEAWNYPLPGDSVITTIQRVIVDVDGKRVIRFQMPADQHRSTLCDHIICRGDEGWTDVKWYPDGSHVAFVSTSR
ncbi:MAG: peptidase, partial [Gemmatimonadales bacterium]|nr:peptidase [Gemmatimonadales bacterium]